MKLTHTQLKQIIKEEVDNEIKKLQDKLAAIKGNTPADKGRRAAVQDDIDRLKKQTKKELKEETNTSGLNVQGRTKEDNTKIGQLIKDLGLYAEWNSREGYWFFPEEEETYDELENMLTAEFDQQGIVASFEGIFENTSRPTNEATRKPSPADADTFIRDVLRLGSKNNIFDPWMKRNNIAPSELSTLVQAVAKQLQTKWN